MPKQLIYYQLLVQPELCLLRQVKSRLNTRSDSTFSIEIIDYVFTKGNPGIIVHFEKQEIKSMHYLNIKRDEHGNWVK